MFVAGNELYDAGQYEEAITAFRASHDIVASPNTSYMIARCLRELGRLRQAHTQFRSALREAEAAAEHDDKYAATAEALRAEIMELESNLGRVQVRLVNAPPGTQVAVDELALDPGALDEPVIVPPGETTIIATSPTGTEVKKKVNVPEGGLAEVSLAFSEEPAEAPQPAPVAADVTEGGGIPLRTIAYVAGGVGVVGIGAFAVFGSMSKSKFSELRDACPGGGCPPERSGDIEDGKRFQMFANVGLALGVLGVGAGVTLFVLSGSSREPEAETARRPARVVMRPASVALEGSF
jgi:hypothetical protein